MAQGPQHFARADALAESVIARVGKEIVLGLPLGLGKALHVANALFDRAARDPSVSLKIVTALTLEKPRARSELHRRFVEPVVERLFGDHPEPAYATALREGTLPPNIEVSEFFLLAGEWLNVPQAQQNYISASYSHTGRYVYERGVNVVAHLVARQADAAGGNRYSLSCNPDLTPDLLEARAAGLTDCLVVGQVNAELPFMEGDAALPEAEFSHILEAPECEHALYAPPKMPVSPADHAAGVHIARLVPDGGTLQIGIGSIGDAVAHALVLRHRDNAAFREAARSLGGPAPAGAPEEAPFETGLYGLSEMFVDSFLDLIEAGVVAREVDGALLHAAFFLGPRDFYRRLREMSAEARGRIAMKPVTFVNALYGGEAEKRAARVGARFVNNAMIATLMGAVVSDGLEDGRVVSGVGGQHDFVTQAFALHDARSVIALNATREHDGRTVSNIRWNYGHQTIPRHLRDIVVTEYGAADLRGRSDRDVIAAMLSVADSRFQDDLLAQAMEAGKIEKGYRIPDAHRDNTPERIQRALESNGGAAFPTYPFGTDFTPAEQRLLPALYEIRQAAASKWRLAGMALGGLAAAPAEGEAECLERMGLARPRGPRERVYRALVAAALRRSGT